MPVFMQSGYDAPNVTHVLFNNVMSISNTTFGSEDPEFPGVNVLDQATYNSWKPSSVGAGSNITINTPNLRFYNGVGIAAHTMGSTGSRVAIQHSDNGTDWTTIMLVTPLTDEDIFIIFNDVQTSWFRLNFQLAAPNIGVIVAGSCREFPCTPIDSYVPTHHAKRYAKRFNNSIAGHMLGNRVVARGGSTSVSFPLLNRDWVDGPLINFEDWYNRGNTFFYAGWPGGKPQDCAYAWAGSDDSIIEVEYVHADKLASVSFDMRFYVGA